MCSKYSASISTPTCRVVITRMDTITKSGVNGNQSRYVSNKMFNLKSGWQYIKGNEHNVIVGIERAS